MNFNEIKNRIAQSQSADFGQVFNDSINLFKKTWMQGFLMMCFNLLIVIVLEMIIIVPIVLFAGMSTFIDPEVFMGMSIVAIFFAVLGFLVLISLMMTVTNGLLGGLYLIYKKADHNQFYSTSDFFVLLKKETILKTFKSSLIQIAVIMLAYAMCCLPILYVFIPVRYLIIMYAYNPELSTSEVFKLAFQLGHKNWLVSFLLLIVTGVLSYLGILLCGVGMLFTFAIILIPTYFIYKHAIGFEETTEIDTIGIEEGI